MYLIMVMLVFGILGAAMMTLSVTSKETMLSANSINQAHFLAESGLRYAQATSCHEEDFEVPRTLLFPSGEAFINTVGGGTHFSVMSTFAPGGPLEASAEVFGLVPICDEDEEEPGDTPDDYVVYTGGGGGTFVVPSGGFVDGSVHGDIVEIAGGGVEITGDVISTTSATLNTQTSVGGNLCAATGNVTLSGSNITVGGNIYAAGNVLVESNNQVNGDIFAGGNVTLRQNVVVLGDVHAGNTFDSRAADVMGTVYTGVNIDMRNESHIDGDAHAGGDIILRPQGGLSTIGGDSYAGGFNDHTGMGGVGVPPRIEPLPPSGCPPPPPPPAIQTFTPGTEPPPSLNPVPPGIYGDLIAGGSDIITLQAGDCDQIGQSGCYVFNTFQPGNTIRLDLSTGDNISVFTPNNITFPGNIQVSTDGTNYVGIQTLFNASPEDAKALARRVYWETHGEFTFTNNGQQWLGTILAVDGITISQDFFAVGAFATVDGAITVGNSPTVHFVIADFAMEHWIPD